MEEKQVNNKLKKHKHPKKGKTIRSQITAILLIVALIPVIGLSIGNAYSLKSTVSKNFNEVVSQSLSKIGQIINESYRGNMSSVEYIAKSSDIKKINTSEEAKKDLKANLDNFIETHKDTTSIYLGKELDGSLISSLKEDLTLNYDARKRLWYQDAIKAGDNMAISKPYEDATTKEMVLTFSKAVKDDNGQLLGVLAADVKLSKITELVQAISIGKNGYATVIDESGRIIAHKDKAVTGKGKDELPWIEKVMSFEDLAPSPIEVDGKNFIGFKTTDKASGSVIVAFIQQSEITSLVFYEMILPIIIFGASIILIILFATWFSSRMEKPMKEVVSILDKVKGGDFTEKAEVKDYYNFETKSMVIAMNSVIDDMNDLLKGVKETTTKVKESSETLFIITKESTNVGEEVARAVGEIAEGATKQAAELNKSVNISGDLGEEVSQSLKNASAMLEGSKVVKKASEEGQKAIIDLKNAYMENEKASLEVSSKVDKVAESSNQISTITDSIKAITEQTNLLALNASIEAARAGEAGRGFAVVAEEVRTLAEESGKFAEEISKVVNTIKEDVNQLYEKTEFTKELNNKTGQSVQITTEKFDYIVDKVNELENYVKYVDESLHSINSSKDIVVGKISEVAIVSEETAATTEEVSASSEEQSSGLQEIANEADTLNNYSERLSELIKRFKVEKDI
ncbi:chemotaxis protein [Clostridium sp. MSJ-4]|uniref:Chemotaxis protein n=1 Tax=Clostridium simiarum TaxID=2841506 RepID=A0ABS6F258_9CLOT|nr:methyl-accepting chemotaxis protein [Clostridium simiarum]MBU5592465.1 chemotaxis protein [Clostridium simiarum]